MTKKTGSSAFRLRHEIFVFDAELAAAPDPLERRTMTRNLVEDLLKTLHMQKLGELEFFDATDLRAPGWSFIQPITTSHMSGHYFEKPGNAPHIHIDLYSCDKVNYKKAIDVFDKHLRLDRWAADFVSRSSDYRKRKILRLGGSGKKIMQRKVLA